CRRRRPTTTATPSPATASAGCLLACGLRSRLEAVPGRGAIGLGRSAVSRGRCAPAAGRAGAMGRGRWSWRALRLARQALADAVQQQFQALREAIIEVPLQQRVARLPERRMARAHGCEEGVAERVEFCG